MGCSGIRGHPRTMATVERVLARMAHHGIRADCIICDGEHWRVGNGERLPTSALQLSRMVIEEEAAVHAAFMEAVVEQHPGNHGRYTANKEQVNLMAELIARHHAARKLPNPPTGALRKGVSDSEKPPLHCPSTLARASRATRLTAAARAVQGEENDYMDYSDDSESDASDDDEGFGSKISPASEANAGEEAKGIEERAGTKVVKEMLDELVEKLEVQNRLYKADVHTSLATRTDLPPTISSAIVQTQSKWVADTFVGLTLAHAETATTRALWTTKPTEELIDNVVFIMFQQILTEVIVTAATARVEAGQPQLGFVAGLRILVPATDVQFARQPTRVAAVSYTEGVKLQLEAFTASLEEEQRSNAAKPAAARTAEDVQTWGELSPRMRLGKEHEPTCTYSGLYYTRVGVELQLVDMYRLPSISRVAKQPEGRPGVEELNFGAAQLPVKMAKSVQPIDDAPGLARLGIPAAHVSFKSKVHKPAAMDMTAAAHAALAAADADGVPALVNDDGSPPASDYDEEGRYRPERDAEVDWKLGDPVDHGRGDEGWWHQVNESEVAPEEAILTTVVHFSYALICKIMMLPHEKRTGAGTAKSKMYAEESGLSTAIDTTSSHLSARCNEAGLSYGEDEQMRTTAFMAATQGDSSLWGSIHSSNAVRSCFNMAAAAARPSPAVITEMREETRQAIFEEKLALLRVHSVDFSAKASVPEVDQLSTVPPPPMSLHSSCHSCSMLALLVIMLFLKSLANFDCSFCASVPGAAAHAPMW